MFRHNSRCSRDRGKFCKRYSLGRANRPPVVLG